MQNQYSDSHCPCRHRLLQATNEQLFNYSVTIVLPNVCKCVSEVQRECIRDFVFKRRIHMYCLTGFMNVLAGFYGMLSGILWDSIHVLVFN